LLISNSVQWQKYQTKQINGLCFGLWTTLIDDWEYGCDVTGDTLNKDFSKYKDNPSEEYEPPESDE
jgi:hypothetical protein